MDTNSISQTPLAALTFIAAPALLTNSASLLANSATLRFLRTRELMRELYRHPRQEELTPEETELLVSEASRVERQASTMLRALYAIYLALASFASATLLTLIATSAAIVFGADHTILLAWAGMILGVLGVGSLVVGSWNLILATRISLANIVAEARAIKELKKP
jgi:uncharacterized membrane protein